MNKKIELPYYGIGGDGYIYGRIFKSSMNQGDWVLDAGELEYSFSQIEAFDGINFKLLDDASLNKESRMWFYGGFARVKENDPKLLVVSSKKPFGWVDSTKK
ncbi:hypothetical protein ABC382_00725 [Lysinibacillus sp. 1P01SD]|uniref:hypothetical protein n=1 Tax=Lysinibacillus sp. 1P01SD TaxID=3132285 RepID=UPI0039A085F9